jgi:hypothetical protein
MVRPCGKPIIWQEISKKNIFSTKPVLSAAEGVEGYFSSFDP